MSGWLLSMYCPSLGKADQPNELSYYFDLLGELRRVSYRTITCSTDLCCGCMGVWLVWLPCNKHWHHLARLADYVPKGSSLAQQSPGSHAERNAWILNTWSWLVPSPSSPTLSRPTGINSPGCLAKRGLFQHQLAEIVWGGDNRVWSLAFCMLRWYLPLWTLPSK